MNDSDKHISLFRDKNIARPFKNFNFHSCVILASSHAWEVELRVNVLGKWHLG
jgi:hypothetical protein